MNKKLYRDSSRATLGGVCAGLSDYFAVDLTLIRALFAIAFIIGGSGLLLYVILWIVVPDKNKMDRAMNETDYKVYPDAGEAKKSGRDRNNVIGGLVLITLGIIFLADEFAPWFEFDKFWPLILVAIGVGLIWNNLANGRKNDQNSTPNA
jgi:phage shock protein C